MELQEAKETFDNLNLLNPGAFKVIADLHCQLWGILKGQKQ